MLKSRPAILAFLTALNLLNYIDRFLMMAVSERFGAAFQLSDSHRGAVVTAFMLGYMLTSPMFGTWGDRSTRKGLIAGGVFLWSLATLLSGFATGFVSMFFSRVAVGVGEACYATLSPTVIDDLAPPASKSRWLAVFYAAAPIGAALGYILGGIIEPIWGWRAVFFFAGGPGIILAAGMMLIEEPRRSLTIATQRSSFVSVCRELFRVQQYRYAVLGYIAQTFAIGGFTEWAAPFLSRKLCFNLSRANILFGSMTAVTGLVGTAAGGWLSDKIAGDDRVRVALQVCAWSSVLAVPFGLLALFQPSPSAFLFFLGMCELATFVSVSPINVALLGSVSLALRASAMAVSIVAMHLLGDFLSPVAVGAISDGLHDPQAACTGARGLQIGLTLLPGALVFSAILWLRAAAVRSAAALR